MQILIVTTGALLLSAFYIVLYNRLRRLSVKVEEGSSGIDVALEKRYDMLSEEIEAVKRFLAHERDVYTEVAAIRSAKELEETAFQTKKELSEETVKTIRDTIAQQQKIMDSIHSQLEESQLEHQMNLNQKLSLLSSAGQSLTGVTSAINALAEQYPVLYSYTSMDRFQRDIFDAEEHLQAARRLYNSNVSLYNQKIVSFPYLIVAKLHGMKKASFYETDEKKKEFPGGLLWN